MAVICDVFFCRSWLFGLFFCGAPFYGRVTQKSGIGDRVSWKDGIPRKWNFEAKWWLTKGIRYRNHALYRIYIMNYHDLPMYIYLCMPCHVYDVILCDVI